MLELTRGSTRSGSRVLTMRQTSFATQVTSALSAAADMDGASKAAPAWIRTAAASAPESPRMPRRSVVERVLMRAPTYLDEFVSGPLSDHFDHFSDRFPAGSEPPQRRVSASFTIGRKPSTIS